jgi:hypothetical protein
MLMCGAMAMPSLAATITTSHYSDLTDVFDYVINGPVFDFYARGDTEKTSMTVPPGGYAEALLTPGVWASGDPQSFRVTYDPGTNRAGISLNNEFTSELPVTIHPDTNGLLVTAFTDQPGATVLVHNMRIMQIVGGIPTFYPPLTDPPIQDAAAAPATDYLLIELDLPEDLADYTFVLTGQVTFTWQGSSSPAANQWFEVSPVVTPEPAGGLLLMLGLLVSGLRRAMR